MTDIFNAWTGYLRVGELSFPNWLIVTVGVAVAVSVWLQELGRWQPPRKLILGLVLYSLLHSGLLLVVLAQKVQVDSGLILAFLCCAWITQMEVKPELVKWNWF